MIARRLRSESGFTLIEVIVAAFCLTLIVIAASALFVNGSNSSLSAQRQAEEINVADQQIELIRQELKTAGSFSALAMQSSPSAAISPMPTVDAGTITTDPNAFVQSCGSSSGYLIESSWDTTPSTGTPVSGVAGWPGCSTGVEPLVIGNSSSIVTAAHAVSIGSATGTVYTYVTDTNVGCDAVLLGATGCYSPTSNCTVSGSTQSGNCFTPLGDAKRVIVAVVLNNGGTNNTGSGADYAIGQNSPVYVSTMFTNPTPSNQSNNSIGLSLGINLG